mmetsp:Transcript_37000/g.85394  ORF Transcript_37000/g.85394 Transcript_37000/m.85394 type:complete len:404 (+) Transcript_37000:49-1260(+)
MDTQKRNHGDDEPGCAKKIKKDDVVDSKDSAYPLWQFDLELGLQPLTKPVPVMILGCGTPGRSMGWYHAVQLLEGRCPSLQLHTIVEPFLLGPGAGSKDGDAFREWVAKEASTVQICQKAKDAKDLPGGSMLAIVACRTADMPGLFQEAIEAGCTHVLMEKPGAASPEELRQMASTARDKGIETFVGYNKNASMYAAEAQKQLRKLTANEGMQGVVVEYYHGNAFRPMDLAECFPRCAEGIMKNMCCHELALLVAFHGLELSTLATVDVDKANTSLETHGGCTDFSRIALDITMTDGRRLRLQADRCGGQLSSASVYVAGVKELRAEMPSPQHKQIITELEVRRPGAQAYFYAQDREYALVKEWCAAAVMSKPAPGLVSLEQAAKVLELAGYLTEVLTKAVAS